MDPVRLAIKVVCLNNKTARVSLVVSPKVISRTAFCQNNLETICFWDSAVYSIAETDSLDSAATPPVFDIGQVSGLVYMRLCPDLKLDYSLENGTEYLRLHGNTLQTSGIKPLDHDSFKPGPILNMKINCKVQVAFNKDPTTLAKVIQLNILDKNDNYPERHNGLNRFNIGDPNYTKVGEMRKTIKLIGPATKRPYQLIK